MTHHVHSVSEWLAMASLGVSVVGAFGLVLAFAGSNRAYFDLRRVDESPRAVPVLLVVGPALCDARSFVRLCVRDAAISLAALLMLLSPAAPEATS
ncbi:hypothetical protein ACWDG1_09480 [Streptomyces sp. NPDC001177]